ncbi:NUDIX domain-containing protein [Streptomyces nitrosporeus]|uniref:NUDIX domain-containing protein n=1 Tax=Streptomyces nitrosporeus TaxID=28894 RepID=A0A5J6FHT1_9ACTN|nr:NUDIX hydrolase [Streptomyces nitrosporeus]QEU75918.1 NUDIX domain-containing protein [Streptomyces nitrosporeus]GGY89418.1 ATP/GTP-binding protein [Streptomyces nitrosporeus]
MIVWINGAVGAGKTSAACELVDLIPNSTFYDPEVTGAQLHHLLPRKKLAEVTDFQDLPIWRRMVVDTAAAMLAEMPGVLVVPMTLLRQEYRDEIFGGLASHRIPVRHVLLSPEETILRQRMADRARCDDGPEPAGRRDHEHIGPYREALDWITGDALTIDTSALTPQETAARIAEALRTGEARECGIVQSPAPRAETVAAGVLFFDDQDRVLLVDPTYKPGWEFPGGVVEAGEAPAEAGVREVAEELGLTMTAAPKLLLVDWEAPRAPAHGGLRFLFDGGRLAEAETGRMLLPGAELRGWRFVTEEEAARLLPPTRFERLRWALRAREQGTVLNLEAGVPVG